MKVSTEVLKTVVIQYLEVDGDIMSKDKIIVLPCKNLKTAERFEEFYRNKFPSTQLMNISVIDTNIYEQRSD